MRSDRALALAIGLAALLAYGATIPYALVWDDLLLAQTVERSLDQGGIARLLTTEFIVEPGKPTGFYRPVVLLSFWLNALLQPLMPHVFHLTNVLLHAANSVLVFWLFRSMIDSPVPAALSALLFALTPAQTEAVAFVSGRSDLLAALLLLLAVFGWIRDREGGSIGSRPGRGIGLSAFALACLTKETSLMLPGVLLAWDAIGARLVRGSGPAWWRRNRFWVVGWTIVLAFVALLRGSVAGVSPGLPAFDGDSGILAALPTLLTQAALRAMLYLRLLTIPWPLKVYYTPSDLAPTAGSLAALLLFIGLFAYLLKQREAKGPLMLAWIVGFLLPILKFVPFGSATAADRYLYIPAVGFFLAVGLTIKHLEERSAWRHAAYLSAGIVLVLFGAGTVTRQAVWRDQLTLFGNMVATSPGFFGGHLNLGIAFNESGRHRDALVALRTAINLQPENTMVYYNLGTTFAALGRHAEAIEAFRRSLLHDPGNAQAANNLGASYLAVGRTAEAVQAFIQSLQHQGDDPTVRFNLGNAYLSLQRYDDAIDAYRSVIRRRGDHYQACFNLGIALASSGRFHLAAEAYRRSLRIQPGHPKALVNLGVVTARIGDSTEAIRLFREAIDRDPANALARYHLGLTLLSQGLAGAARGEYRGLTSLDPELGGALLQRIEQAAERHLSQPERQR